MTRLYWYSALLSVFLVSFLAAFSLIGAGPFIDGPTRVNTSTGTFDASFFKIPEEQEVWHGFSVPVPPDSSFLVKDSVPSVPGKQRWPTWAFRSNSDGIRDEEVPAEKPANETRILFLGNSLTMGNLVNESARYTELLQERLNTESDDEQYRVINGGVPESGMFDHYLFLKAIGQRYNPDIVVVSFVWGSDISRAEHRKRKVIIGELANSSTAAQEASDAVASTYLEELTWAESEVRTYGERLITFSHRNGITPVFMTTYLPTRPEYSRWTEEHEVTYIPPPPEFEENPPSVYRYDDDHATPQGHRWLADHIHTRLQPILGESDG